MKPHLVRGEQGLIRTGQIVPGAPRTIKVPQECRETDAEPCFRCRNNLLCISVATVPWAIERLNMDCVF